MMFPTCAALGMLMSALGDPVTVSQAVQPLTSCLAGPRDQMRTRPTMWSWSVMTRTRMNRVAVALDEQHPKWSPGRRPETFHRFRRSIDSVPMVSRIHESTEAEPRTSEPLNPNP